MEKYQSIEKLIPHRAPILCVDEVILVDALISMTSYIVKSDSIFVTGNSFSELGLLENSAQTSFVFLNFFLNESNDKLLDEKTNSVGFISHISSMKIQFLPQLREKLNTTTETELVFNSENLKICNVKAQTTINEKIAFEAEMKMILQTTNL
ncbi:hypothetical protein [Moheibacter sediminis]|uniref:3-hydroxymyristoyl/3-hydroxydecanoyl-(Acyl carrier protein) dehydratase n=1 Tax=Moheibacter sediminis TaxID=1434700 RepID=A0A1W1YF76_9FLAO|nr:hypothetical protein [Moheibacter sediminis]SMC34807.1 hypothetical protein SAMN06296427_101325 [Moheibacter sediminis]